MRNQITLFVVSTPRNFCVLCFFVFPDHDTRVCEIQITLFVVSTRRKVHNHNGTAKMIFVILRSHAPEMSCTHTVGAEMRYEHNFSPSNQSNRTLCGIFSLYASRKLVQCNAFFSALRLLSPAFDTSSFNTALMCTSFPKPIS